MAPQGTSITAGLIAMVARLHLIRFVRCGIMVIGPDRRRLFLVLILSALCAFLEVGVLSIMGALVVRLANMTLPRLPFRTDLLPASDLLLISAFLLLCLVVLNFAAARQQARLCARAIVRVREQIIAAYHGATASYRDSHREGFFQQLAGEYTNRAESLLQGFLLAGGQLVAVLVFVEAAIRIAPHTTLGLIAGLAGCGALAAPLLSRMRRARRDHVHTYRELVAEIGQTSRLSEEIAAFDVRQAVARSLSGPVGFAGRRIEQMRYENRLFPALVLCAGFAMVLALIALRLLLAPRTFTGLVPLTVLLFRALGYLRGFNSAVQAGAEPVETTEILFAELAQMQAHAESPQGHAITYFPGLSLQGVSYAYPGGQTVLDGISLAIAPGEMLGIVGASGSGKSTIASLMMRIRRPDAGQVLVGDMALAEIAPAAWAGLSAFVGQDSRLIHATIADNIRFYRSGFTLAQVKAAAAAAHIDADIAAMPEGYDTMTGPGARGLSGGQRQRLAIARALLASPQLLVLDEPTSALDEASEALIAQTLQELKGRTTIVLIAHRPATLAVCDRVLRLETGQRAAAGAQLRAVP